MKAKSERWVSHVLYNAVKVMISGLLISNTFLYSFVSSLFILIVLIVVVIVIVTIFTAKIIKDLLNCSYTKNK